MKRKIMERFTDLQRQKNIVTKTTSKGKMCKTETTSIHFYAQTLVN